MAKPGATSALTESGGGRSAETRRLLIEAAIETLKKEGFVGASARAIAAEAGANQSLIFYHFGSVSNLLLAALDAVSAERLEHYRHLVSAAGSLGGLVEAAAEVFRTDLDAGYITVLVEMMAGASSSADLGREVAARIDPWKEFARQAIERSVGGSLGTLIPAPDTAYAIVALYLGLEMLSHLGGDRQPALDLFDHARRLAPLLESVAGADGQEVRA
ncbi:MAG: TetR/AcrR family transcriptional regulator [Acidimicrobiales bacterium]